VTMIKYIKFEYIILVPSKFSIKIRHCLLFRQQQQRGGRTEFGPNQQIYSTTSLS